MTNVFLFECVFSNKDGRKQRWNWVTAQRLIDFGRARRVGSGVSVSDPAFDRVLSFNMPIWRCF